MMTSGLIGPAEIITSSHAPLMYLRSVRAMYFGRKRGFFVHVSGLAGEAQARALMSNIRTLPGVATPLVSESRGR